MNPIVFYTHAKNWEDPQSSFGEKAKKHHTDGRTDKIMDPLMDKMTDRGQFIGPASKVGGSKN